MTNLIITNSSHESFIKVKQKIKNNWNLTLFLEGVASFSLVILFLIPNVLNDQTQGTFSSFFNIIQNVIPLLALYNTFIIWLVFINFKTHLGIMVTAGGSISQHYSGSLGSDRTHQVIKRIIAQLIGAFIASYLGYLLSQSQGTWTSESNLGALQSQMQGFIFQNNGQITFGPVIWFVLIQGTINVIAILVVNKSQREIKTFTNKTHWKNNFKWLLMIFLMSNIAITFNSQMFSPNGVISNGTLSFAFGGANNLWTMCWIVLIQYTFAITLLKIPTFRGNLD